MAKGVELSRALARHPAALDLAARRLEGLSFDFDYEAVAQHYGYPTTLLDFSRSKDVAMFFATCAYDPPRQRYCPLSQGTAALYTIDFRELIEQRHGKVLPLGLEPLPRPEAQKALAVRLSSSENLNEMPWARCTRIDITPELSGKYFEMFEGGQALSPDNPFDRHICTLRDNGAIPLSAVVFGIADSRLPQHPLGLQGAVGELQSAGYTVTEAVSEISSETIAAADRDWQQKRTEYFSRIRCRGVCDHVQLP